jgi:hypothetical protein
MRRVAMARWEKQGRRRCHLRRCHFEYEKCDAERVQEHVKGWVNDPVGTFPKPIKLSPDALAGPLTK